jgi:DNA-binding GntR family transcriptional regulator
MCGRADNDCVTRPLVIEHVDDERKPRGETARCLMERFGAQSAPLHVASLSVLGLHYPIGFHIVRSVVKKLASRKVALSPVAAIRTAIARGAFREGEALRQDDLAERYGTSTIPVREALRQLEGEGLVSFLPNRGFIVATLSAAEIRELCENRVLLETHALRLAIPNLDRFTLTRAAQILDASDRDTNYVQTWSDRNWEFHSTLYCASNRPLLLGMIERIHVQVERYLRAHVTLANYRDNGQREHRAILRACRRKDVEAAVACLRSHILDVADVLCPMLEQRETLAAPTHRPVRPAR